MSKKAYIRRLVVRAIEDSLVLGALFVSMWIVGSVISIIINNFF